MRRFIYLLHKRNRLEILAPAKLVRNPLPFLAAVVEVKHRSDRIAAESIEVNLAKPVERVCDQKVAHLVAAVVEDVRAPVRMFTFARIEMFVQRGAVESAQRPRIFRKVRRHPVHDHADAMLMQVVDQVTKIVRLTVTSRRCVVVSNLVTPRWTIRMFFKWQKLDVREAHLSDIVGERLSHFTIRERTIPFCRVSSP